MARAMEWVYNLPADLDQQLEKLAAVGLTIEQMGHYFGTRPRQFQRYLEKNSRLKDAIEKGRANAVIQVGKAAFQMAVSGKFPVMTMFYLKCRAHWKETHTVEVSGPGGEAVEIKTKPDFGKLSTDELLILKKALARDPKKSVPSGD